jgi:hypothetical protein
VKGSGRGGQHQQQQQQQQRPAQEDRGDFAVHASVYGKVQAEPNVNPSDQEGGGDMEEKDACGLPKLGWLATYVGYVPCLPTCLY